MTNSPPEEAPEFRGKTLTPVSPKPVHFPSPASIPILEKQMDPIFNDTATHYNNTTSFELTPGQNQPNNNDTNAANAQAFNGNPDIEAVERGNGAQGLQGGADSGYTSAPTVGEGGVDQDQNTFSNQTTQPSNYITADAPSETAPAPAPTQPNPEAPTSYTPSSTGAFRDASAATQPSENTAAVAAPVGAGESTGVNFQTLLDNLAASHSLSTASSAPLQTPNSQVPPPPGVAQSPTSALPSNPGLPPRPPPQEKPATHPNYAPTDDIRSYHPHNQGTHNAGQQAPLNLAPLMTAAPPGQNGMLPPPGTSYQQPTPVSAQLQTPTTPSFRQGSIDQRTGGDYDQDDDQPWGPEVQRQYDAFLHDERTYVTEGQWDKFPINSRLFIGNLPTEKVTKRDLFHIFHKHGKLAQISIKQAYGFVQFLDANSCIQALQQEQGAAVRGRKMHLEISKPQRNTKNQNQNQNRDQRRRSRSPDHGRGANMRDRYNGGRGGGSPQDRDFRRSRDDYRPGRRSPSPRGYGRAGLDRYDGRRRSRSRSPGYGRGRFRSPSPRREFEDDLPLPRRAARDVPEVQILVLDALDRDFIAWVEKQFQQSGVRCDVLLLSPRLSLDAVVRRQITEGVLAVSKLSRKHQESGLLSLLVFDRSNPQSVRFEEYDDLKTEFCVALVQRARQAAMPAPQYGYGAPPMPPASYGIPPAQYGLPPAQQQPPPFAPPPNAALPPNSTLPPQLSNLDPASLQRLLGAVQQPPPPQHAQAPPPVPSGITPELQRLLGSMAPTPTQQAPYGQPPPNSYAASPNNAAWSSLLGQSNTPSAQRPPQPPPQPPAQQQQSAQQPNMAEIMAQLQNYRR